GWDVQGTIRDGDFYSAWLGGTHNPNDWFAGVIEYPSARHTLLNPEARSVALGTYAADNAIGALISAYAFFDPADVGKASERVLDQLRAARTRRGATGKVAQIKIGGMASALDHLRAREEPDSVMNGLLHQVTAEYQRGAGAFVIDTQSIDDIR